MLNIFVQLNKQPFVEKEVFINKAVTYGSIVFVMVRFWTQYFVLLIYLCIFAPTLYFLNYFRFIINLISHCVSLFTSVHPYNF